MGATGAGKTHFINLVSGSNLRVGTGLNSCTSSIQLSEPFELDGRSVTLVDTPGFDDTDTSDFDILNMISEYLSDSYRSGTKLAGVVYLHRISDFRFGGLAVKNFKIFRHLCGDATLKNVAIVTSMWDKVEKEEGEAREAELSNKPKFFKSALDQSAMMFLLRHILKNHPKLLRIQKEIVDEKKRLSQTDAGVVLNEELEKLKMEHAKELEKLRAEMECTSTL
ncbi:P-loop containing nucleoside triphosphate hydrolase protein [Flagelloscypha sp. PMI_526]|nr:P-loop containing nucleoside triphosphate hydrolase protein [Flagelloscypha sp. PMI_526]